MKMASDQFSIIYHDLWSKRGISSLITKVWYISLTKRRYKNSKQKKKKRKNKLQKLISSTCALEAPGSAACSGWEIVVSEALPLPLPLPLPLSLPLSLPWGASAYFPLLASWRESVGISTGAGGTWSAMYTSDTWADCSRGEELGPKSSRMSRSL